MDCGRFDKLIDSYLDSQLSGSLLAEFHAHRLACRRCSRVVSMLQAAGDVIAHDRCGEPKISIDFADRIVAALPTVQKPNRSLWLVRMTASAAGLAAAAAITLAILLPGQIAVKHPTQSDYMAASHPSASPRTGIAGAQAIIAGEGLDLPANAESVSQHGMLLDGSVVKNAVERIVLWEEYKLKGKEQPK